MCKFIGFHENAVSAFRAVKQKKACGNDDRNYFLPLTPIIR